MSVCHTMYKIKFCERYLIWFYIYIENPPWLVKEEYHCFKHIKNTFVLYTPFLYVQSKYLTKQTSQTDKNWATLKLHCHVLLS
jgi:hypothetical protein